MSFSVEIKKELLDVFPGARHCRIAELSALISMLGNIRMNGNGDRLLEMQSENSAVIQRYTFLVKKIFGYELTIQENSNSDSSRSAKRVYKSQADTLQTAKLLLTGKLKETAPDCGEAGLTADNIIFQQICCKRSFVRGAFLACGSVSNPERMYHFEIAVKCSIQAEQLCRIMNSFDIDAKSIKRKNHFVIYVKESEQISDLLNVMEAHVALMKLENIRILKDVRNDVNRRVNCEAANINKTVTAAAKQLEDISFIRESIGLEKLAEGFRETALLRLENPEASLQELGGLHNKPIGKSGVNHRLKKIMQTAERLRGK